MRVNKKYNRFKPEDHARIAAELHKVMEATARLDEILYEYPPGFSSVRFRWERSRVHEISKAADRLRQRFESIMTTQAGGRGDKDSWPLYYPPDRPNLNVCYV